MCYFSFSRGFFTLEPALSFELDRVSLNTTRCQMKFADYEIHSFFTESGVVEFCAMDTSLQFFSSMYFENNAGFKSRNYTSNKSLMTIILLAVTEFRGSGRAGRIHTRKGIWELNARGRKASLFLHQIHHLFHPGTPTLFSYC